MKILYWTELFWPYIGGVEVRGGQLLRALRERGYEIAVVTSHGNLSLPNQEDYDGVRVSRFPFQEALAEAQPRRLLALRQRVAELKCRFRPDLVHVYLTDPSVFFHLHTLEAYRAPTLLSLCLAPPAGPTGMDTLLGRALRAAAWVTAPSLAILDDARALAPEIQARSSVIYNSLRPPVIEPGALQFVPPRVLCLGRVVADKGFDLALTAWATLEGRFPGARLIIAGDGPERGALELQAARLGVSDSVDFLGWVHPDEVPPLINRATMVVVPSRWREAFGLVALQGAQMSRPVVATRVGGLPEVVVDGETGLLVPSEDADALARAIAFLLDHPEDATRLGQRGRQRAATIFAWGQFVDAHDQLYQELIARGAA